MIGSILIVDDEIQLARHLETLLRREGYDTGLAHSAGEARGRMAELFPDVVLMDLRLGDQDGAALVEELKQEYPDTQFVIITAHGSIRSAVDCTRRGAVDYLTKPFEPDELLLTLNNILSSDVLRDEVRRLRQGGSPDEMELSGRSPSMRQTLAQARQASRQEGIVLLLGESGVGKDHLARWIHRQSTRAQGPFFSVNCAALPRDLAESELFGHEPGAFTGTRGRKRGLLELAESGTLLLNEVGELEPALQSKLLSFFDTRTIVRVGGERNIAINARIFAATNRDLEQEVERGTFRQDLYYRLAVLPIRIPPLRERREDLPQIAARLLDRLSREMALPRLPQLTTEAMEDLLRHDWPGNIRELRNVLERAAMAAADGRITAGSLSLPTRSETHLPKLPPAPSWNLHDVSREVARAVVTQALQRCRTKQEAAAMLGLTRHALAYQIKALDLES